MMVAVRKRLASALVAIAVLVTVMACQFAYAFDDSGDLFVTAERPYPVKEADGYYLKTEKAYVDGELHYSDVYENTFDSKGRLVEVKDVETRGAGDLLSDHTFYYTYTYDSNGNIIEQDMDGSKAIYDYRSDGSHVINVHDRLSGQDESLTFDPLLKAYKYGDWKFEYDKKGRKIKQSITTDDYDSVSTYSYVEDSSGRVVKKTYSTKENSQVVDSGEVVYTYSNNGRTETMKGKDSTLVFEYNPSNLLVNIKYTFSYESGEYKLSYDSHGNLILATGNHTQQYEDENGKLVTSNYTTRYEATYETNSKADSKLNGIVQGPDGKWAMYKNGVVDTSYTGVAKNNYGWWRVEKGYVNFKANGIYKNDYGWWKVEDGKVNFNYTGVAKNDYGWWRVEKGKVNFKANGVFKNEYGWWKVEKGKVNFKYTGVAKNDYGWWRIEKGKVNFKFTGIAKNENGTWYLENGKVNFKFSGKVKYNGKTYRVTDGKAKLA